MTYLKSYKWTYDLEVNGKKVITDGVPPITSDEETLNERQSSFINYVDGMGEENTPNKDNHESVEGKHHATYNVYENDVIEVTRYEDVENSPEQSCEKPELLDSRDRHSRYCRACYCRNCHRDKK